MLCGVYLRQTAGFTMFTLNASNIYQFLGLNYANISPMVTGILSLIAVLIATWILVIFRKNYSKDLILKLSLLFALILPFLMPKMHERYFFLADILSFAYVIYYGLKRWHIHILVVLASFFAYSHYLFDIYEKLFSNIILEVMNLQTMALFNLLALILVCVDVHKEYTRSIMKGHRFENI